MLSTRRVGKSMSREVAESAISLAGSSGYPFHIQLSGGEPTLEPMLIEWISSYVRTRNLPATIGIQTNGTRIDKSLADIFQRYDIQVGISLDGEPEINDAQRGETELVLKGMAILAERGVSFRVTTVITSKNVFDLSRLILMLGSYPNMKGIGFDLLVRKGKAVSTPEVQLPSPDNLQEGLGEFFEALQWVNRQRSIPIRLRELDLVVKKKRDVFCHAAVGESMAVIPDGSIYPCSQTAGDPDFSCGTIDGLDYERLDLLKNYNLQTNKCQSCCLEKLCPGECPSRLHYNGNEVSELTCVMYRMLWEKFGGNRP